MTAAEPALSKTELGALASFLHCATTCCLSHLSLYPSLTSAPAPKAGESIQNRPETWTEMVSLLASCHH